MLNKYATWNLNTTKKGKIMRLELFIDSFCVCCFNLTSLLHVYKIEFCVLKKHQFFHQFFFVEKFYIFLILFRVSQKQGKHKKSCSITWKIFSLFGYWDKKENKNNISYCRFTLKDKHNRDRLYLKSKTGEASFCISATFWHSLYFFCLIFFF